MGRILAFANQKGGVGKTTSAINLATSFAALEFKHCLWMPTHRPTLLQVLVSDPRNVKTSIYECMVDDLNPEDIVLKSEIDFLDLIPSHIDLVGAEIEMINLPNRDRIMKRVLDRIKDQYDFIILDCSPSLGIVTVNALVAAIV